MVYSLEEREASFSESYDLVVQDVKCNHLEYLVTFIIMIEGKEILMGIL